jgi:hypothetical protein
LKNIIFVEECLLFTIRSENFFEETIFQTSCSEFQSVLNGFRPGFIYTLGLTLEEEIIKALIDQNQFESYFLSKK